MAERFAYRGTVDAKLLSKPDPRGNRPSLPSLLIANRRVQVVESSIGKTSAEENGSW